MRSGSGSKDKARRTPGGSKWILIPYILSSAEVLFALWLVWRFGVEKEGFRNAHAVYYDTQRSDGIEIKTHLNNILLLTPGCLQDKWLQQYLRIPREHEEQIARYTAEVVRQQEPKFTAPLELRRRFLVFDAALLRTDNLASFPVEVGFALPIETPTELEKTPPGTNGGRPVIQRRQYPKKKQRGRRKKGR